MKTHLLFLLVSSLFFVSGLQAQTADDCIAEYESLKSQFEATAADAEVKCAKSAQDLSLDREGPFPASCKNKGAWNHWHLEARSTGKKGGSCSMRLRGQKGVEGCGTEEFLLELSKKEAKDWQKYLKNECKK